MSGDLAIRLRGVVKRVGALVAFGLIAWRIAIRPMERKLID